MKLTNKNKKMIALIGSFVTLAIVLIALLLAVAAAFPKSFGWFAEYKAVNAEGMNVAADNEKFDLAVNNGTTAYDPRTLYGAFSTNPDNVVGALENSDRFKMRNADSSLFGETTTSHIGIFCALSNDNPEQGGSLEIAPGSFGKLEFFIVPKVEGLETFQIDLHIRGFVSGANSGDPPVAVTDDAALRLLSGHILLFEHRTQIASSAYYNYSDRVDGTLTYRLSDHAADRTQSGGKTYYRVTLYWIWPATFGQLMLPSTDARQHSYPVFADPAGGVENADRTGIVGAITGSTIDGVTVDENTRCWNDFFYFVEDIGSSTYSAMINGGSFSDDDFVKLSDAYNNGDQVLGERVRFAALLFKVDTPD